MLFGTAKLGNSQKITNVLAVEKIAYQGKVLILECKDQIDKYYFSCLTDESF